MTVIYDEEIIKSIITDLSCLTGLSFSFVDSQECPKPIYTHEKEDDEFCHEILKTAEGKIKCVCSDELLIKLCRESGRAESRICHAGILDTAVPIKKDGITVGTIIIGRIRTNESVSDISKKLSWLSDANEAIERRYKRLSYFPPDKLESLKNLISNLLFDKAIRIDYGSVIAAATEYLDANIENELSVDILCKKLYLSKNKLYREFHKSLGCTVNDYITERRIEKAKKLLLCSTGSVREIAFAVGIENYTYFSKIFKKRVGFSPLCYRRTNKS